LTGDRVRARLVSFQTFAADGISVRACATRVETCGTLPCGPALPASPAGNSDGLRSLFLEPGAAFPFSQAYGLYSDSIRRNYIVQPSAISAHERWQI